MAKGQDAKRSDKKAPKSDTKSPATKVTPAQLVENAKMADKNSQTPKKK